MRAGQKMSLQQRRCSVPLLSLMCTYQLKISAVSLKGAFQCISPAPFPIVTNPNSQLVPLAYLGQVQENHSKMFH